MRLPWRKYDITSDEASILNEEIHKLKKKQSQLIMVCDDLLDRYDQHHDKLLKRIDQRERRANKSNSSPPKACQYFARCNAYPDLCHSCKIMQEVEYGV